MLRKEVSEETENFFLFSPSQCENIVTYPVSEAEKNLTRHLKSPPLQCDNPNP